VQALDRRETVTSVPPACAGLSHEEINQSVDRAIRTVAGPHRKVIARRLAHKEAAYLSYLVTVIPPRAQPPPVAAPSPPSGRSPPRLAALAAWVVTATAGAWLLAGWLAHGGLRRPFTRVAGVPRPVVVGHAALALTGLGIWIAFLVTGVTALAWTAVGVVLVVAGLGMATLAGGLPEGRHETATGAGAGPDGAEPTGAALAGSQSASSRSAGAGSASAGRLPIGGGPGRLALGCCRRGRRRSRCPPGNRWPASRSTARWRRARSCWWCSPRSGPADVRGSAPGYRGWRSRAVPAAPRSGPVRTRRRGSVRPTSGRDADA